ncbi:Glycosyltransferase involved in cell wall bisynthesis [Luteibacter sp. UNC138MFCol5.1]|uniref:glycosyltransferase family 4 protein n=1 Tax=Luteibacter sp. UNC138MFCol5.1 TaxID=1502774 RepID=UPI0008BC82B7|nr:glycosyltransferase family 1 protein [Luteibacter sp. UNC138MFCol5.1]SEO56636.1 Glycosyltransferase involved in cell wall bisynthesis [Luteibacter sp. UNC138MFCol5.1]
MRIGIVTETYAPDVNGVALTVQSLARGIVRRGHSVDLVRPIHPATPPLADAGMDVLAVDGASVPRYAGLRFGLPARFRLERRWRSDRPDAIYVATEGPLGWSAVSAARRLGIPVATGFHTRFDFYVGHYGFGALTPLVRHYLARFHRRAQTTLVPTGQLAAELNDLGVHDVRVLRRAVDTLRFHPERRDDALRASWGVTDDAPVVLSVGRVAPEKNLHVVIDAYRALARRVPGTRCVIVGDGPGRAALQAAHPDVIFAGTRRGDELAAYYASADLFVFPSLTETFGNVVLEAMASGVPVVAYAEAAAREFIRNGQNGIRVAPGNEGGLIERAAALGADATVRAAMGRAARASVASLSPESVVAAFESIMQSLAEEHVHERSTAVAA